MVAPIQPEAAPAAEEAAATEATSTEEAPEERISSPSGSSQRKTRTKAPKRLRSKSVGSSDEGSSKVKESEPPVSQLLCRLRKLQSSQLQQRLGRKLRKKYQGKEPLFPQFKRKVQTLLSLSPLKPNLAMMR